MILISALTVIFFFGGWLSPFDGGLGGDSLLAQPGFFWFGLKTLSPMFTFLWLRAPSRAIDTIRSCASAGRGSFRSPWCGLRSRASSLFPRRSLEGQG